MAEITRSAWTAAPGRKARRSPSRCRPVAVPRTTTYSSLRSAVVPMAGVGWSLALGHRAVRWHAAKKGGRRAACEPLRQAARGPDRPAMLRNRIRARLHYSPFVEWSAKATPFRSWHRATRSPPGTSNGPCRMAPPRSTTCTAVAFASGTRTQGSQAESVRAEEPWPLLDDWPRSSIRRATPTA